MKPKIAEGVRLFNSEKFFEAHEALEEVWLKTEGKEKVFLHGLIQVAAAFHHHTRRNHTGFRSLLEKGIKKLETCGEAAGEIDLHGLRHQLQPWRESLHSGGRAEHSRPPSLPRIETNVKRPG